MKRRFIHCTFATIVQCTVEQHTDLIGAHVTVPSTRILRKENDATANTQIFNIE